MTASSLVSKIYHLLQSEGVRQSMLIVVGNILSTGISAIALILISRMVGPSNFGEFSVGFALIIMLNRITDLGLNASLQKYIPTSKTHEEQKNIINVTIALKLGLSLAMTVIGLWIAEPLAQLIRFSNVEIIKISFIANGVVVAYETILAVFQSIHQFSRAVFMNTIQATIKFVVIGGFFLMGMHDITVIFLWYTLIPGAAFLWGYLMLPKWFTFKIPDQLGSEFALLKSMAGHSAVGFMAAGFIDNIDVFFVQKYLTSYETGLLSGISRIAMMLSLVAYSLGSVLYARVARYKDKKTLSTYLKKSWLVALAAALGCLALLPFSQYLIVYTVGREYLSGTNMLNILLVASFMTIALIPFQSLFYTFKNAEWYFSVTGIAQLLIVVIGNAVFVPQYGLEAAVWTRLIARLALLVFTIGLALHLYRKLYR